jgi:hypothetical protein
MYFADPSSPMATAHLARIRANMYESGYIPHRPGDGHHFDDIDILPSLAAGGACPRPNAARDDSTCGPAWNRPITDREVADWRRFPSARAFMGFTGLAPADCSSGERTAAARSPRPGPNRSAPR